MSTTVTYLTKRFPRLSETFILDEIIGLEQAGVPLRLYAIADPHEDLVQPDVARVTSPVTYLRAEGGSRERVRVAFATLRAHARLLRRRPRRYLGLLVYIARERRHVSTLVNFAQAGRLTVLIEAEGARHVHAAFAHGPASVAHFVHLLSDLPFSFSAHAKDIYVSSPDLLARKIQDASFVLTCSRSAHDAMVGVADADAAKVLLAHHGVNTERFAPSEATAPAHNGPMRILAVGRLVPKKGYPVLLGAIGVLVNEGRDVDCSIVGAGPERDELAALVASLGIGDRVHFLGALSATGVAASYHGADVFVQASVVMANGDRDGIPNSLLEAMASGLAVVASNVAGIPEVVTADAGLLVAPGDAEALARALARLQDEEGLREGLGQAARRHMVESFDRRACASAIAPLFDATRSVAAPVRGGARS
ncbi:MAG: glycosyltransferase [Actinomycetales bacterium]|nr:glycosyltransferase [Actinomycetales bacterium]